MADKVYHISMSPGAAHYFQILNAEGGIYNGSTFEAYNSDRWGFYNVPLARYGSGPIYAGDFPASLATGVYVIVFYEQLTGTPLETDPPAGSTAAAWDGDNDRFLVVGDILAHGDANWKTVAQADIAAAVLVTPANKLAANAQGEVVASNMRGTDGAYTGTPPTAQQIASAVWDKAKVEHSGAGTFGRSVADIETKASALDNDWKDGGRLDVLMDAIKAATDRWAAGAVLDVKLTAIHSAANKMDTMLEPSAGVYRFTGNALANAPASGGDATEAKQDAILAAIGALNDLSGDDVKTAMLNAPVEAGINFQTTIQRIMAILGGNCQVSGSNPFVMTFKRPDGSTTAITLSFTATERTVG